MLGPPAGAFCGIIGAVVLQVGAAVDVMAQDAPWPTTGWSVSSPSAQGMSAAPLDSLDDRIRAGTFGNVDRMVVVRNGYLVVNQRYDTDYQDISRGQTGPLGCGTGACVDSSQLHEFNYLHPDFHPWYQGRDVHSLQSVTKSVTSVLIGVAIGRGEIDGVDAPLLSFFEAYDLSSTDPRLRHATLDDLLTMRSGIEWHEGDRPLDSTNTTIQLEASEDWIQFTLDQPMDADPGEKWVYNSGGSHLMSGIIKQATGQFVDAYAEAHLFGPLGIEDYHWKKSSKGYPDTEGGLYLEAEQLAKIGYLYLQDGVWGGERLVPEGWVAASTARHAEVGGRANWGYGYQWWRTDTDGTEIWAGLGFGGQFLVVIPQHGIVAVINSWNVFGGRHPSVRGAFVSALLESVGH
ncbi:MAG: serine hydrolase [Gemmatimonadales bacterium]